MKRKQIKLGGVYCAKVSGKLVDIVITDESRYGGWTATNCITGRVVHIKTAGRLRYEITKASPEHPVAPVWPDDIKPRVAEVLAAGTEPTKADKAVNKDGIKRTPARVKELADKQAKPAKPAKPKAPRKLSGLDLAAQVLSDMGKPMTAGDITAAVIKRGWATKGQTPSATLYAAMLREIDNKPGESRFEKVGRGLFALVAKKA